MIFVSAFPYHAVPTFQVVVKYVGVALEALQVNEVLPPFVPLQVQFTVAHCAGKPGLTHHTIVHTVQKVSLP